MTTPGLQEGSIGDRLLQLQRLAGLSTREFDRLADQHENHFAIILHRLRKNPDAAIELGTAAAYCNVVGARLDWLYSGEGRAPSRRLVAASVDAARARLQARQQTPSTGTGG